MKDIDDYQIVIIGFIVHVSSTILERTKIALTKGISCVESDDRSFIYDPSYSSVPRRKGESAGRIGNYRIPPKWNWQSSIKDTIEMMHLEDQDSHKLVVMITDKIEDKDIYQFAMGMNLDVKLDAECKFVVCGIGDFYSKEAVDKIRESHKNCEYKHHNLPEELENTINCLYTEQLQKE